MPTNDTRKKLTTGAFAGADPKIAAEPNSHRVQLKKAAGAAGFEGGQALLRPARSVQLKETPPGTAGDKKPADDAKAKEEEEKKRFAAAKKSYEEAFGSKIGGAFFDLVHKELSAGKMLGYGKQGFDALGGAASALKPTDKGKAGGIMDEAAEAEAVRKFSEALLKWTAEEGKKWLESDDGKALLAKINHWVEGHPWTVALSAIGLALSAATIAYLANADLPNIAQKFKLGKGLELTAGVDLGKLQQMCVQGAELGLSYHSKHVTANISAKYTRKEGENGADPTHVVGVSGDVSGGGHKLQAGATLDTAGNKELSAGYSYTGEKKLGPDDKPLTLATTGKVKVDKDGNTVIDASGSIKKGPFSTTVGTKRTTDESGEVTAHKTTASVAFGDQSNRTTVDGSYDHTKEEFTLSTANVKKHTGEGYELTDKTTTTGKGTTRDLSGKVSSKGGDGSNTALTMGAHVNEKGKATSANLGLTYNRDWFKTQLDLSLADQKTKFGVSAEIKKDGWLASGGLKLDLDETRLTSLSLKLGYKDPKEFKSFLLDYSHTWNDTHKGYDDKFGAMLEYSLGDVMMRVDGNVKLSGGDFSSASVKGIGAYSLSKDWKLLGGAGYKYDAGLMGDPKGGRTTVYGGAQFKGVPILVGYTPQSKAWTVGVTIPFPWSK